MALRNEFILKIICFYILGWILLSWVDSTAFFTKKWIKKFYITTARVKQNFTQHQVIIWESWDSQNYAVIGMQPSHRNSYQRCSIKEGFLKNFAKFTGKHLCQSFFLTELLAWVLWQRFFPVNFAKFLRIIFLWNISGRLLLTSMNTLFSWKSEARIVEENRNRNIERYRPHTMRSLL